MSLFQGWADAPSTGAYPQQVVSDVFRQAVEEMKWLPFAIKKDIASGQSITIPIRGRLAQPSNASLSEPESIPLDKLTITAKTISPGERGRGVELTRKAINRSPIDLLNEHRMALAEQMALDFDTVLGAAFESGQLKYAATGLASYNLAAAGSFGAAALSNPNFYHVRKMRDLAYKTYHMPKLPSGGYAFVCTTMALRGILDDPEFIEINKLGNPSIFRSNVAGTIADVEIHEENHTLSDSIGTNSDVGEGVFIARDAVYYAVIQQPRIILDMDEKLYNSFGRFPSLAWYGDWAAGTSSDSGSAGFARLIHFGSS